MTRRGFSFTEILFAVIILGIGFIMVAAIFPVALQQAKSNTEEITAASLARSAMPILAAGAYDQQVNGQTLSSAPPSGGLVALLPDANAVAPSIMPLREFADQHLIQIFDDRYAWAALYSRGGNIAKPETWDGYATVYLFPMEARISSRFIRGDISTNLIPHPVRFAVLSDYGALSSFVAFDVRAGIPQPQIDNVAAAVDGAWIVVADDKAAGATNGRMYRIGARREDREPDFMPKMEDKIRAGASFGDPAWTTGMKVYELIPGNGMARDGGVNGAIYDPVTNPTDVDDVVAVGNIAPIPASHSNTVASTTADGFIIGRGMTTAGAYEGPSMAITAFVTRVLVAKR